jgi:hypothetical protein
MDFWPESPASVTSGVEKWISGFGFYRASGNQKPTLLYPRAAPRPGECPTHFFYVQNAPYISDPHSRETPGPAGSEEAN